MAERAYKLEWLLGLEKETLANMVLQQSKVIEKLQQAVKAQAVPEGWKLVPVEPTPDEKDLRLREKWCAKAVGVCGLGVLGITTLTRIYDALLSGELTIPSKDGE